MYIYYYTEPYLPGMYQLMYTIYVSGTTFHKNMGKIPFFNNLFIHKCFAQYILCCTVLVTIKRGSRLHHDSRNIIFPRFEITTHL